METIPHQLEVWARSRCSGWLTPWRSTSMPTALTVSARALIPPLIGALQPTRLRASPPPSAPSPLTSAVGVGAPRAGYAMLESQAGGHPSSVTAQTRAAAIQPRRDCLRVVEAIEAGLADSQAPSGHGSATPDGVGSISFSDSSCKPVLGAGEQNRVSKPRGCLAPACSRTPRRTEAAATSGSNSVRRWSADEDRAPIEDEIESHNGRGGRAELAVRARRRPAGAASRRSAAVARRNPGAGWPMEQLLPLWVWRPGSAGEKLRPQDWDP